MTILHVLSSSSDWQNNELGAVVLEKFDNSSTSEALADDVADRQFCHHDKTFLEQRNKKSVEDPTQQWVWRNGRQQFYCNECASLVWYHMCCSRTIQYSFMFNSCLLSLDT